MEFDRIIADKHDADSFRGAEQAIQDGRKAWCYWQLYREIQYRLRNVDIKAQIDLRQGTGFEQRLVQQFVREFNEDPMIKIEQNFDQDLREVRR